MFVAVRVLGGLYRSFVTSIFSPMQLLSVAVFIGRSARASAVPLPSR
ncbi:hypothetical protein [Vulcanisaeta sp. JCM 14467]|nr:hypothetical protein [Vulcanisaeta sp. JCM 14467]